MAGAVIPFSDEQMRLLVNLEQQYEVWIDAEQTLFSLPYGMKWKRISRGEYLYELADRAGNGRSLGPRSEASEARYAEYQAQKTTAIERRDQSAARLAETGRLYRALRLPMLASEAAAILREADRRSLLGSHLLVVGTNAMPAYAIEAAGRIADAPDETQDFDMAWTASRQNTEPPVLWPLLKAVDATYTINTERPNQARNASAYEVELLVAPSCDAGFGRRDRPRPVPLEEQEWLLNGRPVSHVVVARDASTARIVAPDTRWFAMQKLWLSEQGKRNPLKRPKDARQATALLRAVAETMPQYPLDAEFEAQLPPPLMQCYARWKSAQARP
jgi:hypothetical protein